MMDITQFIATHRETLLIADYAAYRAQLSRQLRALRKRLGRATARREKFAPKPVTAEDVARNHEFAHLLILTAERAWAHAMQIKTARADDPSGRGITGSSRSHLLSRLHKAGEYADRFFAVLGDVSETSATDLLEARAYRAMLSGSEEFERQAGGQREAEAQADGKRWELCLKRYAEARVIYAAMLEKEKKEVFRELLANTIDPTIRYAAYQAHLSRTIPIPAVAKRFFPKEDKALVKAVEELDEFALKDKPAPKTDGQEIPVSPQDVPSSITWRGRKADIVDASIGQALANVAVAEARLRAFLSSNASASSKDKAAAYDDILNASQDAADATKRATDELEKEKTDEGDRRMQDLRMTSLSVNYDLVSWRVGRNRVLIGDDDGLMFTSQKPKAPKHPRKDGSMPPEKEEARGRKLVRLRERVVLYDASIQSVESIKDLPGAMRDAKFVDELDAKSSYFRALKCLNISYSHSLLGSHTNALALLTRAQEVISRSMPPSSGDNVLPTLDVRATSSEKLRTHVDSLLLRTHALVEMHTFEANSAKAAEKRMVSAAPLVKRLDEYPAPGTKVDLTNLVTYPPKLQPLPVKPIFLDVAFNYIEYPGRTAQVVQQGKPLVNGAAEPSAEPQQEKKKSWFGFGR